MVVVVRRAVVFEQVERLRLVGVIHWAEHGAGSEAGLAGVYLWCSVIPREVQNEPSGLRVRL